MNKIAVVLPVYNHGDLLLEALSGILITHPVLSKITKIILVNDGSTDNTDSVISNSILKLSQEIELVYIDRKENKGLVYSLNEGFTEALKDKDVKYLTWTSADNNPSFDYLLSLYISLTATDGAAVYSDYCQINEKGEHIRDMSKGKYILNGRINFGPSFMVTREVVEAVGLFDKETYLCEDRDWCNRIALHIAQNNLQLIWLKKNIYKYRMHSKSLTSDLINKKISASPAWEVMIKKWGHLSQNPVPINVVEFDLNTGVV